MRDFDNLARQISNLYSDEISVEDLERSSPLYSELKESQSRYSEKQSLAKGGMKSISRVFDNHTGRYLAIAELHSEAPEELREPFIREARLTALLEHPNIISVHDIGINESNEPYFTMDLKVGDTLGRILRKLSEGDKSYTEKYTLEELLTIFLKICNAVSYAHSRDVIHLDLKPENIQVGKFGEVLVCDWGLGKILDGSDDDTFDSLLLNKDLLNNMTMSGEIKGTPGYMAPEQILKNGHKTKKADIFALGSILYEMLTLSNPFKGVNTETTLANNEKCLLKSPGEVTNQAVPKSLEAVAMHALQKDPAERYSSVEQLQLEITKFMQGYSTFAENAGFLKEISLFVKRNQKACLVALISLMIIISLGVTFILETKASYEKEVEARQVSERLRERADYVAEQYKRERNESTRLVELLHKQYHEEVQMITRIYIFNQPEISIQAALRKSRKTLALEPDNLIVKRNYVYCLFLVQDFQGVIDNYTPSIEDNEDLYELSKKYVPYVQPDGLLSISKLAELILEFPRKRRSHLIEKMLAYDEEKRSGDHNYYQVVKAILKVWNPEWNMMGFSFNEDKGKVEISNPQISMLTYKPVSSSKHSILRFLDCTSLNLQKSGVYDLNDIKDLPLTFLNICDTNINDLRPLQKITTLKYIWVKDQQFSESELSKVPRGVKIVVK